MPNQIKVEQIGCGNEELISEFAVSVFNEHVAPGYSDEGIEAFKSFARPEAIKKRLTDDSRIFVCKKESRLLGVAEIRNQNHLSMLFVDSSAHGKGIGKKLLTVVCDLCRANNHSALTVNSSLNAQTFYASQGFQPLATEQCVTGIRFIPMELEITS